MRNKPLVAGLAGHGTEPETIIIKITSSKRTFLPVDDSFYMISLSATRIATECVGTGHVAELLLGFPSLAVSMHGGGNPSAGCLLALSSEADIAFRDESRSLCSRS